jgi:hypothetical protein
MKRIVIATLLVLIVSGSALAGDIPSVGAATPAPPPQTSQISFALPMLCTVFGFLGL